MIRNPGNPNFNGITDESNIDLLSAVVNSGTNDLAFDLTDDDLVNADNQTERVNNVATTLFGDTNLNRRVEFNDFNTEGG